MFFFICVDITQDYILCFQYLGNTFESTGVSIFPLTHHYITYGEYNVTVNISNFVSSYMMWQIIQIDQPIVNLRAMNASLYFVRVGYNTSIEILCDWGSRMDVSWDWKDGEVTEQYYQGFDIPMEQTHIYTTPGTYNVLCSATNVYTTEPVTSYIPIPIIAQYDILNISLICPKITDLEGPEWIAEFS